MSRDRLAGTVLFLLLFGSVPLLALTSFTIGGGPSAEVQETVHLLVNTLNDGGATTLRAFAAGRMRLDGGSAEEVFRRLHEMREESGGFDVKRIDSVRAGNAVATLVARKTRETWRFDLDLETSAPYRIKSMRVHVLKTPSRPLDLEQIEPANILYLTPVDPPPHAA